MFADYRSLVLQDYAEKKVANKISQRLVHPTSAKLKEECKAVCSERFLRKDDNILRTFFGQSGDAKITLQAIERCETDKFKPLANFLKRLTNNTDDKNIELLAWLIDFQPRPYEFGKKYTNRAEMPDIDKEGIPGEGDKKEESSPEEAGDDREKEKITTIPKITSGISTSNSKIKIAVIAAVILTFIGMFIYWLWSSKASTIVLTGNERCMYWAGDHYQAISCSQKLGDTLVVALDSVKLNNFKRITDPDTITQKSKGVVWYVKVKGNIEFYTSGGYHPVDPQLRLKPITDYIINKYIH
jgi:hypothetical protein